MLKQLDWIFCFFQVNMSPNLSSSVHSENGVMYEQVGIFLNLLIFKFSFLVYLPIYTTLSMFIGRYT